MGIIEKDRFEEKGTVFLEESRYSVTKRREPAPAPVIENIEISAEELPMLGPYQEKAQKIVANAEAEARQVIQNAQAEIDRIRDEARNEGFEQGKREGIEQATGQFADSMETLNEAIIARRKIIKDAESEILRLALKVAEQIIRSEVSLHRDVCLNIVAEAISRISDREQIIIKVNRDDVEHVKKYKDRISSLVDGVKSLTILEDGSVEPGGCIIETNLGYVDARISTKIKAIEEAFSKVKRSEPDV